MAEDQGSEAWLDRQKQKLSAMQDSRYHDDWKDRQNRQLVEELKSRQSSWKEEKTEKTTESIESSPIELGPASGINRTTLHPIQIGTLGEDSRGEPRSCSAKYYYETKHKEVDEESLPTRNGYHGNGKSGSDVNYLKKESYFDERRTTTDSGPRYRALNSLPLRPDHIVERSVPVYREHGRAADKTYLEDSRSVNSYSQGYNTLTSEDEYGYDDRTLKSRTGGTMDAGRTEVTRYGGAGDTLASGGGRIRSQSFGTSGGPRASDIFREAVRHVGPDGEIIYTSRRYDTKKTTTNDEGRAPRSVGPVAIPARQYYPVSYEPPPHRVDSYVDEDGAVVVTETYKRVREVRTDGQSVAPVPALVSPLRERLMLDSSRPAGVLGGGDQEEYMYRRKLYESQTVPAPAPAVTQSFSRSRSAHDFQNGGDYYRDTEPKGGKTYYYHKTSSYDDVDPPASARSNGYAGERYYRRGEAETERGSQGYVRQQPLQSQRYSESRRYNDGTVRRENEEYRTQNGYSRTGYENRYNTTGGGSTSSSYYDSQHNTKRPPQLSHPPTRREIEELNTFLKDFGDTK